MRGNRMGPSLSQLGLRRVGITGILKKGVKRTSRRQSKVRGWVHPDRTAL